MTSERGQEAPEEQSETELSPGPVVVAEEIGDGTADRQPRTRFLESSDAPPPGLPTPRVVPVEEKRETLRGRIAGALLLILAFIVVGSFLSLWFGWGTNEELTNVLSLVFAPVVGLVGAVTGFYYGEKYTSSRS
jgi:hypothetical protein